MGDFQQYLLSLPRPKPEDRELLSRNQPYIIRDIVAPRQDVVCPECKNPVPTVRSLAVYVPSKREAVEFNFHSGSGSQICNLEEPTDDHYKTLEEIAARINGETWVKLALRGFASLPPTYH